MPSLHEEERETILLIHGFCSHRLLMSPLARRLGQSGFKTINWGYPSLRTGIASNAEQLKRSLGRILQNSPISRLHIVAHSMGGILVRKALLDGLPPKLGRIVLIGPPNQGSHVASRLEPVLGWFSQPLSEISDRPDSWVNKLPRTLGQQLEVGLIIAGGDLVVSEESTQLPGVDAQVVVPGMHSGILLKPATAQAALQFIRNGSF